MVRRLVLVAASTYVLVTALVFGCATATTNGRKTITAEVMAGSENSQMLVCGIVRERFVCVDYGVFLKLMMTESPTEPSFAPDYSPSSPPEKLDL